MDWQPGTIVWMQVTDPNGRNPKTRPLILVSPLDENGNHDAVAVSSQVDLFREDCCVFLPWNHGGHIKTQLSKKCIARCDWMVKLKPSDVARVGGIVPQQTLIKILARITAKP